jgi:hypothetical protein
MPTRYFAGSLTGSVRPECKFMRAFYFFAMLLLVECRLAVADSATPTQASPLQAGSGTNHTSQSYISDYRGQPIWYSQDEVTTR